MQLCQKHKAFSRFFTAFLKSRLYFQYFDKNDDAHRLCNFEITHSESVVRKFVKDPVSENPSTSKMLNVPKHCWNLHHSTFIIFIDHCQVNWVGKSLCYWHGKCNYLRNKKHFPNFLLHFQNLDQILNILRKNMTLMYFVISKMPTPKTWSDKCLKSQVWENHLTSNMVHLPKHCWNLHHSTFIIFTEQCQVNWVGKRLSYWHAKSWDCLLTHWLPMKRILFLLETI